MNSTPETTPAAPGTTPLFVPYDPAKHEAGWYWSKEYESDRDPIPRLFEPHHGYARKGGTCKTWAGEHLCSVTYDASGDCDLTWMDESWIGPRIPSPEQLAAAEAKGAALDVLESLTVSSSIYFQPGCNNVGVVMFLRGDKNGTEYDTAAAAILAAADRAGAGSAGEG